MTANEVKDRAQKNGINLWFLAGCNGTLQYATGVGKSRCGVLASQWLLSIIPEPSILVLTPTQTIRDQAWRDEFKKWGAKQIFDNYVDCACIQTAYKYEGKHYDLVIADEIHNYVPMTDDYEYFKFFENNKIDRLLGLSASIDDDLLPKLNTIAPIVDSIDTNRAVELKLVSPFTIYNIPIEMSDDVLKDYANYDGEFFATFQLFNKDLNLMFSCLKSQSNFRNYLNNRFNMHSRSQYEKDALFEKYKTYPYRCNNAMKKRKEMLYENEAKLDAVVDLVDMLGDRYGVIFNQTSKFADKVGEALGDQCIVEHSKIKPAKKRKENLKKFADGRTKEHIISAVKSLNEGANLPRVEYIVIASGTSKLKDFIQRVGRSIRWEDGKKAIIVRLYIKNSQEEKWVESSQEGYEVVNLNHYNDLKDRVKPLSLDEIEE